MSANARPSAIAYKDVVRPRNDSPMAPTWGVVVFLIITFLVLKTFIYIKDGKRHGK